MAKDGTGGGQESRAVGLGEHNAPIPKQKPKVVRRQDGWLYDENGRVIGQSPDHPDPSPVPDL